MEKIDWYHILVSDEQTPKPQLFERTMPLVDTAGQVWGMDIQSRRYWWLKLKNTMLADKYSVHIHKVMKSSP